MDEAILPYAWKIVNDALRTDACLVYPPYLVALAAIYMACVFHNKRDEQQLVTGGMLIGGV